MVFKQKKYLIGLLRLVFSEAAFAMFVVDKLVIRDSVLIKGPGGELRTDIMVQLPLWGITNRIVILSIILEHKSYKDRDAVLQAMEYYVAECKARSKRRTRQPGEPYELIIPVILLCCEDKDYEPPQDYLSWEFGSEEIPPELAALADDLPVMRCKVFNLRKPPLSELWTKAGSSAIIIYVMAELWGMDEDKIALIIEKIEGLERGEGQFLGNMLMDYCDAADRGVRRQDFDRVDRKRWPHKREEERFVPTMYFGLERAERRGLQKGEQLGLQKGIEQGIEKGIEKGEQLGLRKGEQLGLRKGEQLGLQKGVEQKQMEAAQLMLSDGMPEDQVCKFLKLTKKELTAIKRKLKN